MSSAIRKEEMVANTIVDVGVAPGFDNLQLRCGPSLLKWRDLFDGFDIERSVTKIKQMKLVRPLLSSRPAIFRRLRQPYLTSAIELTFDVRVERAALLPAEVCHGPLKSIVSQLGANARLARRRLSSSSVPLT